MKSVFDEIQQKIWPTKKNGRHTNYKVWDLKLKGRKRGQPTQNIYIHIKCGGFDGKTWSERGRCN